MRVESSRSTQRSFANDGCKGGHRLACRFPLRLRNHGANIRKTCIANCIRKCLVVVHCWHVHIQPCGQSELHSWGGWLCGEQQHYKEKNVQQAKEDMNTRNRRRIISRDILPPLPSLNPYLHLA